MKPKLAVLDAVRLLTANGPTGGDAADVKLAYTVAAGADIVGLDAFGATLLGHAAKEIPMLEAAKQRGLGLWDLHALHVEELVVT